MNITSIPVLQFALATALLLSATRSEAVPLQASDIVNPATQVFNPVNNHIYEYVNTVASWTDAFNAAAASSLAGVSGYLVTITSASEQAFVFNNGLSRISVGYDGDSIWLAANDVQTEGSWYWVAGPEAGTQFWEGAGPNGVFGPAGHAVAGAYSNWRGEVFDAPNLVGGDGQFTNADYAHLLFTGGGTWEDDVNSFTAYGTNRPGGNAYVIEYSREVTVPESNTLALLGISLVGVAIMRRRKEMIVGGSRLL